jgi:nicotinate dehydrogenase subunit A
MTESSATAVALRVNDVPVTLRGGPGRTLLWALRDELGFMAAKYGCGAEQCGACRVLLDGVPAFSCRVPVDQCADRAVETLEALRDGEPGRRVVRALIAANAAQCGYCLPGLAVTLTWLARRPGPLDEGTVLRALDDHLCRCGAHPRILRVARALLGVAEGGGSAS